MGTIASRHVRLVATMLAALVQSAWAASASPCESFYRRPLASGIFGISLQGATLSGEFADQAPYNTVKAGSCATGALSLIVPVADRTGVRAEFAGTSLGLKRYQQDTGVETEMRSEGLVSVSVVQVLVGVTRAARGRGRNCGHLGASAGFFRVSYQGTDNTAGVVAGAIALPRLLSTKTSALFEVQLQVVGNGSRPPLRETGLFMLRAGAGIQVRF